MSTSLTVTQCNQTVGWDFEKTTAWGTNIPVQGSFAKTQTFSSGTGAGKSQRLLLDTTNITSGGSGTASYTLDSFTDPFGATAQAMTIVHGLYVEYTTTNSPTSAITIGGTFFTAGGSPATLITTNAKVQILPGNAFLLTNNTAAGYPVTASTGNTITITNLDSSKNAVVNVMIWGE